MTNSNKPWYAERTLQEVDSILTAPGSLLELETKFIDGRLQRVYKNLWPSLREFWIAAATMHGDLAYVILENHRMSYAQAFEKSLRAAGMFRDVYGIKKGDRVGIVARNCPDYIVAFWACHLIGAVSVLVNAWLPEEPLLHCLTHPECKLMILDPERAEKLEGVVDSLKTKAQCRGILVLNSQEGKGKWKGMECWDAKIAGYTGDTASIRTGAGQEEILPEDNATILFTSGTTGMPKGVLSTQRQYLTNTFNCLVPGWRSALRKGESILPMAPAVPQKGSLLSVPFFHATGSTSRMMMATLAGMKIILMRKWIPEEGVKLIKKENVVIAGGVPSMVMDLIETSLAGKECPIEAFSFGGAPAPDNLATKAGKLFPAAALAQGYGLTETNSMAVGINGEDYVARPRCAGLAMPVNDLMIVRDNVAVPPGQLGEVWMRGINVMKGYWRDPVATDKTVTSDGWLKSGDLGYVDEEGFLYIKDRSECSGILRSLRNSQHVIRNQVKDIIIRGGENIDSTTVENALYADDRVMEAAAVAVPHDRLGELVSAVVAIKPAYKGQVTEESLIAIAAKRVSQKKEKGGVCCVYLQMAARDATNSGLQLHDILANMSPSPAPLQPEFIQNRARSATPEILTETDIMQMRHRTIELKSSSHGVSALTPKESELLNMVRRLTDSPLIDPGQLMRQAEVISRLTAQRDFLIRQMEEERGRWASQRDGWERMAEALISQRSKSLSGPTKEDIDRYCAAYRSENKALREKLNDTSSRLQHLESEITKLRPILLMQPVTTSKGVSHGTSVFSGASYPNTQAPTDKVKPKKKTKKEPRVPVFSASIPDEPEPPLEEHNETQPMEDVVKSSSDPSSFSQFQARAPDPPTPQPTFTGDHYRKPTVPPVGGPLTAPPTTLEFQIGPSQSSARTIRRTSPHPPAADSSAPEPGTPIRQGPAPRKPKRTTGGPPLSFTSDARTEHLLLAARKIGRRRAGIVSGYVRIRDKELELQKQEREREKKVRELEDERIEKGRRERLASGASYYRQDTLEAGSSNPPRTPKSARSRQANAGARASATPAPSGSRPPGSRGSLAYVLSDPKDIGKGKEKASHPLTSGNDVSQQQSGASTSQQQSQSQTNPSTPLASLIDAARMMGGDEEMRDDDPHRGENIDDATGNPGGDHGGGRSSIPRRRSVSNVDQPENPPRKRIRMASARAAAAAANNPPDKRSGNGSGSTSRCEDDGEPESANVMTALHFLADQAAAFSSHDQRRGKGKTREVQREDEMEGNDVEDNEDDVNYAPPPSNAGSKRGRGKGKVSTKEKQKPKPKARATRKPRGKATAAATSSTPRLISTPAPKFPPSTISGHDNPRESVDRGNISTPPPAQDSRRDDTTTTATAVISDPPDQ
ncbi:hypothetical protein H0H93_012583, partial [Arthromyces matolae]